MSSGSVIDARSTAVAAAAGLLVWSLTVLAPASQAATDPCASPTIVGTDASEDLTGTDGPDVIDAGGGDDVVHGLGGNDVICGGDGGDTLIGGAGDDQLYGEQQVTVLGPGGWISDWRPDVLDGGPGNDYFDGGGTDPGGRRYGGDFLTFQDAAQGVTVDLSRGTASGDGADTIVVVPGETRWNVVGSPFADSLSGTNDGNWADHSDAEVLIGGTGDDFIFGNYGDDTLFDRAAGCACAPGMRVVGGGADTMDGGGEDDFVFGGAGDDKLSGNVGHDGMRGGRGDDTMNGGPQGDGLYAGPGDDTVSGSYGNDVVMGGAGRDVVSGDLLWSVEQGSDKLFGGPGADRVLDYGQYGDDTLRGNGGDDVLRNSLSHRRERVAGGHGRDTLRRAPENRSSSPMVCRSIEHDRTRGQCR